MHRAPRELAVADFAATGRTHAARLADRVGREVVVEHEALLACSLERVDHLLVFAGAERGNDHRLRLTAREQCRAVRPRQHVHLGFDAAHRLEVATIDALAGADDVPAHDVGFELLENAAELRLQRRVSIARHHRRHGLGLGGVDHRIALLLLRRRECGAQILLDQPLHLRLLGAGVGRLEVPRLLRRLLRELDDRLDHRLETAMAEHDGLEHLLLAELLGFRLDHHHGVMGAGDDEVEIAVGHLVDHRIEHELAADQADAGAADRTKERQARKRQRSRRGYQRKNVGIVLEIVAQHRDDDLGLVLEPFDEQRADRTIDQPRGQRVLLGRAAFTFEKAAWNLAGGEKLLLVVDGQREKIDARLRLFRGDDRGQQARLAVLGINRGVGLARHAARLERQLATAPINLDLVCIEHIRTSPSFSTARAPLPPWARR